jgi:hypothetical protein
VTASIVPFEPAHWQALAPRLHGVHRARIESLGAVDEVVPSVLAASSLLRTALIDGEPVAIMGMTEADGVGYPWLMKTDVRGRAVLAAHALLSSVRRRVPDAVHAAPGGRAA